MAQFPHSSPAAGGPPTVPAGLGRAALLLVSSLLSLGAVNLIAMNLSLWYCSPLVNHHLLKLYALATDANQYQIVILGSSVAERSLVPQVIEEQLQSRDPAAGPMRVYNCAVPGSMLPMYREAMRGIIGRWQRPRLVLLAVGPRDFNGASERVPEQLRYYTKTPRDYYRAFSQGWRPAQQAEAIHAYSHGLESVLQWLDVPGYQERVAFFQANQGGFFAYPLTPEAREINHRILPLEGPDRDRFQREKLGMARDKALIDFTIDAQIRAWFEETIQEARARDVTLVVVLTAESAWFQANAYQGSPNARDLTLAYVREVCRREGVPFFDLSAPPFRPDEHSFYDGCQYLDVEGSIKLTRLVTQEVLLPALAPAAARQDGAGASP
jgi:hypothetical protein